jgi:hypothetical protein
LTLAPRLATYEEINELLDSFTRLLD